jgi:YfiH family protein
MAIQLIKQGTLEFLASDRIMVPHCFTTRLGGVSQGHLASLNIGIHRDDQWENVLKNYEILGNALGFDIKNAVLSHQTHSDTIRVVTAADAGAGLFTPELPECDALITNVPGLALTVFTADCTPILLSDPVTGAVGAVHAGWRGTASSIVAKAVMEMTANYGSRPEDIRAVIGPNIGQCCFETHEDVAQAMWASFGTEVGAFIRQSGDKFHIDLKQINALALRRAGVCHMDICTDCTACHPDRYWSHRVTGGIRGSQGAMIVCEEGEG